MITEIYNSAVSYLHSFANDLAAGDSMAKGLIIVGVMGTIIALCRNVPSKLWKLFLRNFTVTVNVEYSWQGDTMALYRALSAFVTNNQRDKNFLVFMKDITNGVGRREDIWMTPNYSSGLFFYKGRPFYYNSEPAKENGAVPASIGITTLGTDVESVVCDIKLLDHVNRDNDGRKYYVPSKDEWSSAGRMYPTSKIFLREDVKRSLDEKLDFFMNNEQWYYDRGIARKLLIIVYGPPGTGKSRISRYVADYLNRPLATMGHSLYFSTLVREAARKGIVVSVPDFDTLNLASRRNIDDDGNELESSEGSLEKVLNDAKGSTLNEILNLFQGDIPLNDSVVVMSTNTINSIDPALLRRGRCDVLLHINELTYKEVQEFRNFHYGIDCPLPDYLKDISIKACDLVGTFEDHPNDVGHFTMALSKFVKSASKE